MATITKRAIAERIAKQAGQTQAITKDIIQKLLDEMVAELVKGNKLEFRDFGIFEPVLRRSRQGRNPRTGEEVFVPAKNVVSFKMGRRMKELVANSTPIASGPAAGQTADEPSAPPTPPNAGQEAQ